ncbi:MAG: acetolactate decarboxylase [Rhizobiales bacterium 24-66-13]|jgi:acetolactate decarboxylase|nr:MAG: acetolactate decarboxylase [Rhizobiales bacterium 24-66-13]OZB07889.1 MAG: acetolactate decarboxylase [Rhizobiales bacterium 39-66-18]HQS46792.1 acetolactate decarboxylase [Xanthobacteraceae bacterium]
MPTLNCEISQSLWTALQAATRESGETISHIVSRALADTLQVDHGTLFQVSTSGALVEGLFKGVVSVGTLREHGDFGLGTFVDLDGEMIALDGAFFQMRGDGSIRRAEDSQQVPFAIVTHFAPQAPVTLAPFASIQELVAQLDALRHTDNVFFAVRLSGHFARVHNRVACKAGAHETLVQATSHQAEFECRDVDGSMIGFWTPSYAKGLGVPGWHVHFISDDHRFGGHVLECAGEAITLALERIEDFRIAIPESADFLAADLSGDTTQALDTAERVQKPAATA